ncbi:MAG TPA: LemA family protein [Candidatus Poseidoniaceae archaeon]|nr:MAG TPA: LemA family protein [Candidatus Poseidoniales archaeon]HII11747.1 LemA family protein [Candidatus Poseidoniaceae archaeon]|tara:strand:+ start:1590 stop:2162 length:573 start_codon:yes stop_codon:yes gene_type:complete
MVLILFAGFFLALVGAVGLLWVVSTWNRFVNLEMNVIDAWADFESDVKMKYELLPDLHATVKGYAKHEKAIFDQLSIARQGASGALAAQNVKQFNQYQNQIAQLTPRFNAISENYPNLKADALFMDFSQRLVTLEERLANGRETYNSTATIFNKAISMLPDTIVASIKGVKIRELIDVPDHFHQDYVVEF